MQWEITILGNITPGRVPYNVFDLALDEKCGEISVFST